MSETQTIEVNGRVYCGRCKREQKRCTCAQFDADIAVMKRNTEDVIMSIQEVDKGAGTRAEIKHDVFRYPTATDISCGSCIPGHKTINAGSQLPAKWTCPECGRSALLKPPVDRNPVPPHPFGTHVGRS